MANLSKGENGPFMAEQIIDKIHASEPEMVPSYQVYVIIAFLRHINCISQKGREGYEIPIDINDRAKEAWEKSFAIQKT